MSVVLVAARRTAIATAGRGFADHGVDALAAPVLAEAARLVAPAGLPIDDVILGNCMGPGGDLARVAALRAGLGADVPGVTVDRQCGSGLDAVMQAAARVRAGDARLVLAGGAESTSTAPHRFWPGGERYTRAPFAPVGFPDPDMGPAADRLAAVRGISRERQDDWAARSHARAAAAQADGRFDGELVAVDGVGRDERPRASMTLTTLARFPAAFAAESSISGPDAGDGGGDLGERGTVTAGNSCGFSDGAAAMAVTTEDVARGLALPALRVRAAAVAASDPALPGLGAAPAAHRALERAGIGAADLGFVEITEAFAAQVLAVSDELRLDEELISADGGAIALGHPWGASGAVLLVRLAARMAASDDGRPGLAACSIGGGQGIAMVVERLG